MFTNFMVAIDAAARDDLALADEAIGRAERKGLDPREVARFRKESGVDRRHHLVRAAEVSGGLLALWAFGLLAIFVAGKLLSGATLRAVERYAAERGDGLMTATRGLRRIYAFAIGTAGVYYYLSIPIVTALVLGLMGLLLYGILMAGYIPIKLVLILVVGGGFTIWGLARALFARRAPDEDPGRRLPEPEAPALWAVLRQVASEVGFARPVDDVFITPGTEIGVAERGTMTERLRDQGRRYLILGVGVLEGLTDRQLRAVLAHEYGHFSNRDTAGGNVAAQVRVSLMTAVIRIARGGGASVFNPAWHFLRVFLRAVSAGHVWRFTAAGGPCHDRFAAVGYGGTVFAEGLRHVVRRNVQFSAQAAAVIRRAQEKKSLAIARPAHAQLDEECRSERHR